MYLLTRATYAFHVTDLQAHHCLLEGTLHPLPVAQLLDAAASERGAEASQSSETVSKENVVKTAQPSWKPIAELEL